MTPCRKFFALARAKKKCIIASNLLRHLLLEAFFVTNYDVEETIGHWQIMGWVSKMLDTALHSANKKEQMGRGRAEQSLPLLSMVLPLSTVRFLPDFSIP
jgi:hypothetical protein